MLRVQTSGILLIAICTLVHAQPSLLNDNSTVGSATSELGDNHHILFLLVNVTPSDDFKGALLSCGFEAAAQVAQKVGYKVKVLTSDAEAWAAADQHLLRELPIDYVALDPAALVDRTPLQQWYNSGAWKEHPSPFQDLSNGLRVAAVYKYGGMYLDSDIIMTGTQLTQQPMFLAKQDEEVVNNHLFRFPAGHAMPWLWMQRWMATCTAQHQYGACGPGVLHPLFHERCMESNWPNLCAPVIPPNMTTPFTWDQITGLVAPNTDARYQELQDELYGVHWFSTPMIKWSKQQCTLETSFLHAVALKHCPNTLLNKYDALICDVYRITDKPTLLEQVLQYKKPVDSVSAS